MERGADSVNLRGTGLEEPTRKDKEECAGEGRIMDYEESWSEGNRGNPEVRNPEGPHQSRQWRPLAAHEVCL